MGTMMGVTVATFMACTQYYCISNTDEELLKIQQGNVITYVVQP